jgi:hypothetical protein
MLQEAMDELLCPQRATLFRAGLGVAIAQGDLVIFQLEEPVVAQGNAENVRRQIVQGVETRAHPFTVDDPILLPDAGWDAVITVGLAQRLLEPGSECEDGKPGCVPRCAARPPSRAGHRSSVDQGPVAVRQRRRF